MGIVWTRHQFLDSITLIMGPIIYISKKIKDATKELPTVTLSYTPSLEENPI